MTPELKAVAVAICIENLKATRQPTDPETIDSYWSSFVPEARAALIAILKPTPAMIDAHEREPFSNGFSVKAHEAMISYVLK